MIEETRAANQPCVYRPHKARFSLSLARSFACSPSLSLACSHSLSLSPSLFLARLFACSVLSSGATEDVVPLIVFRGALRFVFARPLLNGCDVVLRVEAPFPLRAFRLQERICIELMMLGRKLKASITANPRSQVICLEGATPLLPFSPQPLSPRRKGVWGPRGAGAATAMELLS